MINRRRPILARWLCPASWVAALLLGCTANAQPVPASWSEPVASGTAVAFRVQKPASGAGPWPAVVVLGGFERGAAALDLLPDGTAAVLAGFDYPLALPRRVGWTQVPALARDIERGIADTCAAVELLQRRLRADPDVDAARITLVGASLGAPFALIGAADLPPAAVVIVHGFADVPLTLRQQFRRRWQPRHGGAGIAAAWAAQSVLTAWIDYPDPRQALRRWPPGLPVLVLEAAQDDFVPDAARQGLLADLAAAGAQVQHIASDGVHLRGRPEQIAALFAQAQPWLGERQLLAPAQSAR